MKIRFDGRTLEVLGGETVLDCVERHGIRLPASCRSGFCQSCLVRATRGRVPPPAQQGLKPSWRDRGYLLACQCYPAEDLTLTACEAMAELETRIVRVERLGRGVVRALIERPSAFAFSGGQFIHVIRPSDALSRPYSLAADSGADLLELHVALVENGAMSSWLRDATQGCPLRIRGPFGECSYDPEDPERPLLLAGTGTGLAPLLGVIRDALRAGHRGPIRLYHGARSPEGLYEADTLFTLRRRVANLEVVHCVLETDANALPAFVRVRSVADAVFDDVRSFDGWSVYLCGNPAFVHALRKRLYLAGVSLSRIHSDPFVESTPLPGEAVAASS